MRKRTLFVGSSGPIGYDYNWTKDEVLGGAEPYAILEDLNGILLCYDELIFSSRAFCPREMWELPYITFIEDDSSRIERVEVAAEQFSRLRRVFGPAYGVTHSSFPDVIDQITSGNPEGIDNHGRGVQIGDSYAVMGNAGDLDQVFVDMGMAASLEIPDLDVLTNTLGTERLTSVLAEGSGFLGSGYKPWHLSVASEVAVVSMANTYSPGKSYFEEVEDLRAHPNLRDFRSMLSSRSIDGASAKEAADEISHMVDRFAKQQVSKRYGRRPWYRTFGRVAVGPIGNFIHPGLGTVGNGALKVVEYVGERQDRAIGKWAAFVADLRL